MIKEFTVYRDKDKIGIRPVSGYLHSNTTFKVDDTRNLFRCILELLGLDGEYFVVLRKRRKA